MFIKSFIFISLFFISVGSSANPELHWRFANPTLLTIGSDCVLQFDIELSCTAEGTYHSNTMVYLDYNTAAFGETIVMNGKISYTPGNLTDIMVFGSPGYSVISIADQTINRMAITTEANFQIANPLFMEMVPQYPQYGVLYHITMIIANQGQPAGIEFVEGGMDNNQFYMDETHPTETPYGTPPSYAGIYDNNLLFQPLICSGAIPVMLDVKAILEGPFLGPGMNNLLNSLGSIPLTQPFIGAPWNYNGTENVSSIPSTNIVDWVLLELRDAVDAASATSSTAIEREACFILSNGSIVSVNGYSMPEFQMDINYNLFVVVWHRNHLGIMSANPVSIIGNNGSYDFTISGNQAFGGTIAQKQLTGGIWGMYSGDGNADGNVMNSDKIIVWRPSVGMMGYLPADFNLDGNVGNPDKIMYWSPNVGKSCQVP